MCTRSYIHGVGTVNYLSSVIFLTTNIVIQLTYENYF
jgi:hypothetical protein